MDIFIVTAAHFAQASAVTSYHATEREAHIAAAEHVNLLRADLASETLPLVNHGCWQLGLLAVQLLQLEALGFDAADIDRRALADSSGLDVRIEKAELQGMSHLALDDRELSTVLAALRDHQRRYCPSGPADIAGDLGRHEPLSPDEIDDLCTRINSGAPLAPEANIVVTLDGGLVQGIAADRPITVRVVDFDVEGANPDDLVMVPRDEGDPVPASVSGWAVESVCIDPEWIASLDAVCVSEDRALALMAGECLP